MTFAYSATLDGMKDQIEEVENGGDAFFLAQYVMRACKEILRQPAKAMEFIRELAKECADKGKVLELTTPTGFPWANRYHKPKTKIVELELGGVRVRHKVADGYNPGILKEECMDSASPNLVHSLDASHLINVILAAVGEGITSVAVVHDCFGCHAPNVTRMHKIIRAEMAKLYSGRDVLAELRAAAKSSLPLPARGTLDPREVQLSTYAFA